MHILGILIAVIGGAAAWYWRLKMLKDAGSDISSAVGRARGAYRMRKFRKKAEGSVLASIDDPALAASVFLFVLANENSATAHHGAAAIRAELTPIVPADQLDEVLAYGAWAARDVVDAKDCVRRFKTLWREKLTSSERAELVSMSERIAALSSEVEPLQIASLEALRAALTP